MDVEIKRAPRNLGTVLLEGLSFKIIRSNPNYPNHSIILKEINTNKNNYIVINSPIGVIGDLYTLIIINNEEKREKNEYLDIRDISCIISEFESKNPDSNFELNIGLSLSLPISTDNVNYYGKTYKESDYIYEFPGNMYMCMVANDCEPDRIYIMVGGLEENGN